MTFGYYFTVCPPGTQASRYLMRLLLENQLTPVLWGLWIAASQAKENEGPLAGSPGNYVLRIEEKLPGGFGNPVRDWGKLSGWSPNRPDVGQSFPLDLTQLGGKWDAVYQGWKQVADAGATGDMAVQQLRFRGKLA